MSEIREINPLSREVIKHLHTIAQQGPLTMIDPRNGAIHGTSLETINTIVDSGVIIGYSHKRPTHRRFGDLSVFPTRGLSKEAIGHLTDPSIRARLEQSPQESLDSAKNHAKNIAQRHAFLTALGIPLQEETAISYASELFSFYEFDWEMFYRKKNYFRRRGFSHEAIDTAFEESLSRRGFLLGLSPDIALTPGITLNDGDGDSSDIRVSTSGSGFPYKLLSGIQPLGPVEEAFLRNI